MVANTLGSKNSQGQPLTAADFFPDLAVKSTSPKEPSLRLVKGSDPEVDVGIAAGWDRWAQICQAVARRGRKAGVA